MNWNRLHISCRGSKGCHSLRDFLLFHRPFRQLLAGPINQVALLRPQYAQRMRASCVHIDSGLAQFAMGAVKQVLITEQISPPVGIISANQGKYYFSSSALSPLT